MSSIMIVGADHLGSIENRLHNMGFKSVLHIKGRNVTDVKINISKEIKLVLVITDYINHNLAKKVKEKAKEFAVPIVYSKRSWSSIHSILQQSKIS